MNDIFEYRQVNGEDRVFLGGRDIAEISRGNDPDYSSLATLFEDVYPNHGYIEPLDAVLQALTPDQTREEERETTAEALDEVVWETREQYVKLSFAHQDIDHTYDARQWLQEWLELAPGMDALYQIYRQSVHCHLHDTIYNTEKQFVEWLIDAWDAEVGGFYGEGKPYSGETEGLSEEVSYTMFEDADSMEVYYIIDDRVFRSNGRAEYPLSSIYPMIQCEGCETRWNGEGHNYWQPDGRRQEGIKNLEQYEIVEVEPYDPDMAIDLLKIGNMINEAKDNLAITRLSLIPANWNDIREADAHLLDYIDKADQLLLHGNREAVKRYSAFTGRHYTRYTRREVDPIELLETDAILTNYDNEEQGLCPVCREGLLKPY